MYFHYGTKHKKKKHYVQTINQQLEIDRRLHANNLIISVKFVAFKLDKKHYNITDSVYARICIQSSTDYYMWANFQKLKEIEG